MPLPAFNLRGRHSVSSLTGGIMSVVIVAVIIFYTSVKFVHLTSRHNPSTSSMRQSYFYDSEKQVDLVQEGLRVAFGVEGYLDGETKDDPRFVKYLVRIFGKRNGTEYEHKLDYHTCSSEELD